MRSLARTDTRHTLLRLVADPSSPTVYLLRRREHRNHGISNHYHVLRCVTDVDSAAVPAGPSEARAIIEFWRTGLLSTTSDVGLEPTPLTLTRHGHHHLEHWNQQEARQRRPQPPGLTVADAVTLVEHRYRDALTQLGKL